jgi:sec-independent protein translocase protein TatA
MFGMGHWELLIIFLVILLIFGAKRIPDMAQGLGKGIKEFRKAMHEVQEEIDINPSPPTKSSPKIETTTPEQAVSHKPAGASEPASEQVGEKKETSQK